MTFDDGSTVEIKNNSGGSYGCFLVQSVRLADGTLYSIVRVQDNGTIDVQVTTGSKFEVVTPSAIVGVRGTQFTVATSSKGYEKGKHNFVSHNKGNLFVTKHYKSYINKIKNGGKTSKTTGNMAPHSHYHTHEKGERHMHDHPSQNQAHHGKAQSGTDDDGSSADPDDITICHKPGTNGEKTMVISASALSGHLGHGDSVGACP
jgi:hypothetical protein